MPLGCVLRYRNGTVGIVRISFHNTPGFVNQGCYVEVGVVHIVQRVVKGAVGVAVLEADGRGVDVDASDDITL